MDLRERAAVHAALGDPARLRIVDRLAASDASPSELGRHLDLGSNLLAHHLRVLEDAGLVVRHRSHADRRRTYLRLSTETLQGLLPSGQRPAPVERVVFVCTANSARSQLAAARWLAVSEVPVASGGTRPATTVAPGAVRAARRHGIDLPDVRPRSLEGLLGPGDHVVTVCDAAHEELDGELGDHTHWSVPDPVTTGTDAAFDAAVAEITARVEDLSARLGPTRSSA